MKPDLLKVDLDRDRDRDLKSCQSTDFGKSNLLRIFQILLKSVFQVIALFILLESGYLVAIIVNFVK